MLVGITLKKMKALVNGKTEEIEKKLKQDIDKNILFLILLLVVAVKEIVKKCK